MNDPMIRVRPYSHVGARVYRDSELLGTIACALAGDIPKHWDATPELPQFGAYRFMRRIDAIRYLLRPTELTEGGYLIDRGEAHGTNPLPPQYRGAVQARMDARASREWGI